ncbi:MAG: hypothetical protein JXK07_10060 [Spirochaetes bacterium]|nr:hypothetical protein [Spirochaetota bacterium]MBN2771258.1 hypothetical protein [Spirochaetota bacterium]
MYSDTVKSEAFLLFCQGHSFSRIAEILSSTRTGCEKIKHSTVSKWSQTPDFSGKTWTDRKREYQQLQNEAEGQAVATRHKSILDATENMITGVISDIESNSLEFKTKDAAIYAYRTLADFREKIKDKEKTVAIEDQVSLLLESFKEDEVIGPLLSERWDSIYRTFADKVEKLSMSKRHGS